MMAYLLPAACFTWVGLLPNSFVVPRVTLIVAGVYVAVLWKRVPRRAFVFLAVMLAATVLSADPWRSLKGLPTQWSGGLFAAAVYVALLACPTKKPWLPALGVVMSLQAVAQLLGADARMPAVWLPAGRAVAYIGSAVDLGAILAMAAPAVPLPFLPIVAAGLWATGSRAAWLAAAVAVLPWRWRVPVLAVAVAFLTLRPQAPKDVARFELWKIAGRSVAAHPWLGSGPETFRETFIAGKTERLVKAVGPNYLQAHAHNDLLEAASCMGLLGLLAYLWLVIPFLRNPSLLALFIVLKFDPVAFEVLACAAVIAATDWAESKPSAFSAVKRFSCWVLRLCLHCEQPLAGRAGRIFDSIGNGYYDNTRCRNPRHVENP